jgi:hypothetical protein
MLLLPLERGVIKPRATARSEIVIRRRFRPSCGGFVEELERTGQTQLKGRGEFLV